MSFVNIVLSDRGWILEKLAKEISDRLPYVRYGTEASPSADIQYYMTYSTWRKKISEIEVGYFAHMEEDEATKRKFFSVARSVDYSICHSRLYENILRDHGVDTVVTISPGVNLGELKPLVKIGVVGRTYHTGRKGEALVRQVMDISGIEWHFTGEGWPGPAQRIAEGRMSDFYNAMDYILVPALYEGGPMSVVEALACGCEVIAPPIGWVSEFPHIEYKTGDSEDLRRVLNSIIKQRNDLRTSVLDRTWDAWAEGHDRLFNQLAAKHSLTLEMQRGKNADTLAKVTLAMHGDEARSLGGPSVRVPRTAEELRRIGFDANVSSFPDDAIQNSDLVHGFNVWSPKSALALSDSVAASGKPLVFSSIFLDLSERELWQSRIPSLFSGEVDADKIDISLTRLRDQFQEDRDKGIFSLEGMPGHHQRVREIMHIADHVILLSNFEKKALGQIGAVPKAMTVVHNPVDGTRFGQADPTLFSEQYGIKDYILCVARIEPRKNQLLLLHALRELDLPIVLIGHATDSQYSQLVDRYRGENVHFLGRIAPDDPLLPSAIAGCRVFVLPSWSEGAPLAALEAAAAGANMVLSDRSSEPEYFQNLARYCDPSDPQSIRDVILEAYQNPLSDEQKSRLKEHVAEKFSWDRYARATAEVYQTVLAERRALGDTEKMQRQDEEASSVGRIVLDVTTSCNHSGRWTGISRSEMSLALALNRDPNVNVAYIAWSDALRQFIEIPSTVLRPQHLQRYFSRVAVEGARKPVITHGDSLLVCGSAWMQNQVYADQIVQLANVMKLNFTFIVHDIIPTKFPFWFQPGYAPVFERNLETLFRRVDRLLTVSEHTGRDATEFAARKNFRLVLPKLYTQGSEIGGDDCDLAREPNQNIVDEFAERDFVLNVGAIHSRKNHRLLYDLWVEMARKHHKRCPHLVIVGGVAWNGEDVARAFREDRRLDGIVHILENIDDTTLDWLYKKCLFTVYPSLYEGWGLPVAESLARGKVCIASDISSVPEIAPKLTDLVDPLDFRGWLTTIEMYATSRSVRSMREAEILEGYSPRTWEQAKGQLLDHLSVNCGGRSRPIYTLGDILQMSRQDIPVEKRTGWHIPSSAGLWSSATRADLALLLREPAERDLLLTITVRANGTLGTPRYCDLILNGENLGRISFYSEHSQCLSFFIPHRIVAGRAELEFTIIGTALDEKHGVNLKGIANRPVGICLQELAVAPVVDFHLTGKAVGNRSGTPACRVNQYINLVKQTDVSSFFPVQVVSDTAWGVRSERGPLRLRLNVHEAFGKDLTLKLTYRASATPDVPVDVMVTDSTGSVIGYLNAEDDSLRVASLKLTAAARGAATPMVLTFTPQSDASPSLLGVGFSSTIDSIGIFGFILEEPASATFGPTSSSEGLLVDYGQRVDFGANGTGAGALEGSTWHDVESDGVWSLGHEGKFSIDLPSIPKKDFAMYLHGAPFVPFEEGNDVEITVNGVTQRVDVVAIDNQNLVRVEVSSRRLKDTWRKWPTLQVTLSTALVNSPFKRERVWDDRVIGFFLRGLTLHEIDHWKTGIGFDGCVNLGSETVVEGREGLQYLHADTWHEQEIDGIWSNGHLGKLTVGFENMPERAVKLRLLGSLFIPFDDGNEIRLEVDGLSLRPTVTLQDSQYCIEIEVPANCLRDDGRGRYELPLSLWTKLVGRPSEWGHSGDARNLGFFLRSMKLCLKN